MHNRPIKKIFVCEFITGGGLNHSLLDSTLVNEGKVMRDALLNDLASLPYDIVTTVDARLSLPSFLHNYQMIEENEDVWVVWENIISKVDAVWFIAPETDGYLHQLTSLAIKYHKYIFGCGITSIDICSSKYDSYLFFKQAGLDIVETMRLPSWNNAQSTSWVVKPDDGAGCDDTFYFKNNDDLTNRMMNCLKPTHVIQPFIEGDAASISCVMFQGDAHVLSCNKQLITIENNQFNYRGFIVNGMAQFWDQFSDLAKQVASLLPDLNGYVGLDVIVSKNNDKNTEVTLLEINPRLTTTYAGLAEAIGFNPASLIIGRLTQKDYEWPNIQRNQVHLQVKHG